MKNNSAITIPNYLQYRDNENPERYDSGQEYSEHTSRATSKDIQSKLDKMKEIYTQDEINQKNNY